MILRNLFLIYIFVFLVSCGTSPSPIEPPVALKAFQNQLNVKLIWTQRFGEGVGDNYLKFQPVQYGDSLIYLDYEGKLTAVHKKTGSVIWERDFNLPVSSQFLIYENNIIFGTSQGELIMAQLENDKILWRVQLSSEILSTPAVSDGFLVINTVDGYLYGLDVTNGKKKWFYNRVVPVLTLRGSSSPIIVDGIVLSGFDNGKLIALNLNNGQVIWDTTIALARGSTEIERLTDINIIPVIKDDLIYIATFQGRLAAVELTSGKIVWTRELSVYNNIKVDIFRVYVSDSESRVWALDRKNGATLWKQDAFLRRNISGPALFNDQLVIGDFNGYLHWLSRADGKILSRVELGEPITEFNRADDVDDYFDTEITKVKNILSVPFVIDDIMYATNRFGDMHAYTIK